MSRNTSLVSTEMAVLVIPYLWLAGQEPLRPDVESCVGSRLAVDHRGLRGIRCHPIKEERT